MHTPKIMLIPDYIEEIDKMKKQQKEFIKYLEYEIKLEIQREIVSGEITNKRYILSKILQKYKSIIGVSNDY